VGKSTLVNALVGEKVSIVTSKPNTTRHAILGVLTREAHQIIFIDTPGMTSQHKRLIDKAMHRAAAGSMAGADIIVFVVEAGTWSAADADVLKMIRGAGLPCVLVVNKVDRIKPRNALLPFLDARSKEFDYAEIVPVSALRNDNLESLEAVLARQLPEETPLYPAEMLTDKGVRFRIAELVREKLMQNLRQELPYGIGVEVDVLEETDDRLNASVIIWVSKESHKGIVIGPRGQGVKQVGQAARLELQQTFDCKVHLETRVKVKRNWADNARWVQQLGYGAAE
jgi:GTP-binding protein Era